MLSDHQEQLNKLATEVVGAAYDVANVLGAGFYEKIYERALAIELRSRGMKVVEQAPIVIRYREQVVGEYFADLLVEDILVIELKCAKNLCEEHLAQCLNYLKGSGLKLCLLFNFQCPKVEWKRIVNNF